VVKPRGDRGVSPAAALFFGRIRPAGGQHQRWIAGMKIATVILVPDLPGAPLRR